MAALNPLLRELLQAHRKARQPEILGALHTCGLDINTGPVWGVDYVQADAHHYQPMPNGKSAVIVPYFVDGTLLDLVAAGLATRSSRTRRGVCTVLGGAWIDHARIVEEPVTIFPDPIEWLRNGRRGAVIVDWRSARYELADLPGIACSNSLIARRIDKALRIPAHVPPLFVRETRHAA